MRWLGDDRFMSCAMGLSTAEPVWLAAVVVACRKHMREMLRVPRVWTKHHFSELKNLIAFAIGGTLNRHLPVEIVRKKMEVVASLRKALKLPNKKIAARWI